MPSPASAISPRTRRLARASGVTSAPSRKSNGNRRAVLRSGAPWSGLAAQWLRPGATPCIRDRCIGLGPQNSPAVRLNPDVSPPSPRHPGPPGDRISGSRGVGRWGRRPGRHAEHQRHDDGQTQQSLGHEPLEGGTEASPWRGRTARRAHGARVPPDGPTDDTESAGARDRPLAETCPLACPPDRSDRSEHACYADATSAYTPAARPADLEE